MKLLWQHTACILTYLCIVEGEFLFFLLFNSVLLLELLRNNFFLNFFFF